MLEVVKALLIERFWASTSLRTFIVDLFALGFIPIFFGFSFYSHCLNLSMNSCSSGLILRDGFRFLISSWRRSSASRSSFWISDLSLASWAYFICWISLFVSCYFLINSCWSSLYLCSFSRCSWSSTSLRLRSFSSCIAASRWVLVALRRDKSYCSSWSVCLRVDYLRLFLSCSSLAVTSRLIFSISASKSWPWEMGWSIASIYEIILWPPNLTHQLIDLLSRTLILIVDVKLQYNGLIPR